MRRLVSGAVILMYRARRRKRGPGSAVLVSVEPRGRDAECSCGACQYAVGGCDQSSAKILGDGQMQRVKTAQRMRLQVGQDVDGSQDLRIIQRMNGQKTLANVILESGEYAVFNALVELP